MPAAESPDRADFDSDEDYIRARFEAMLPKIVDRLHETARNAPRKRTREQARKLLRDYGLPEPPEQPDQSTPEHGRAR